MLFSTITTATEVPFTLLSNPAHIDQGIYELQINIFGMSKQINNLYIQLDSFIRAFV